MQRLVITEEEIEKKLKNLKLDKSPGPDNIHPRVLFGVRKQITMPLKIIFEASLMKGELPTDWRSALVTTIYKKGSKHDVANYRTISFTCILCKGMEALVRDRIIGDFIENKL